MGYPTKIATCCHCGTRTTLRAVKGQHVLSCANCGAPLTDLKMLPRAAPKGKAVSHQRLPRQFDRGSAEERYKPKKRKKPKSKARWVKKMAEGVFDLVEDIFD